MRNSGYKFKKGYSRSKRNNKNVVYQIMTRIQETFVSKCEGLTLSEYMRARTIVCSSSHCKACDCAGMLRVGKDIESKGV